MIASLATWHLAPNERREGVTLRAIAATGSTIVDALQWSMARWTAEPNGTEGPKVVSMHHRVRLGDSQLHVARAVKRIALARPGVELRTFRPELPAFELDNLNCRTASMFSFEVGHLTWPTMIRGAFSSRTKVLRRERTAIVSH